MMDSRISLAAGTVLSFPGMECTVLHEMGRGSNAIVYKATYGDALSGDGIHSVLIKEFFPFSADGSVCRKADNSIGYEASAAELYELHLNSFLRGNKVHLKMRESFPEQTGGNINSFPLNGTYYTIQDFSGGRTLDKELDSGGEITLRRIVTRMTGLVEVLSSFHAMSCLHLDISPDNILLIDKGARERVELIDYNSVVHFSGRADPDVHFSIKAGYASPEVRIRSAKDLGPWTDLYSVTAVFFRYLSGRILSRMEINGIKRIDVSGSPFLENAPETVKSMVGHIIAKGLSSVIRRRYRTAEEMLADLRELTDRIDGVGITHWALWESGSAAVRKIIKTNPSLGYIADDEALYPAELSAPDGMESVICGKCNAVLSGSGGMGKTTMLLKAALSESKKYRGDRAALFYISLYGCKSDDSDFILDSILRRLKFKPETGSYADARHSLELLLKKPLSSGKGYVPALCLLLDGYNEAEAGEGLKAEINRLASMDGVSMVITSRNGLPEFGFEQWELLPLSDGTVREILGRKGLLIPSDKSAAELLKNPMMLSMFVSAGEALGEQPAVQTAKEIIRAYLDAILQKELSRLPEDSQEKWQLEAALGYVYIAVAAAEDEKKRRMSAKELLSLTEALYRQLGKRAFLAMFPEFTGHASEIRGGAENGEEWYGLVINGILWKKLGLLNKDEYGDYGAAHQEFRDTLAPEGRRILKMLRRAGRKKYAAAATTAAAAAIGISIPTIGVLLLPDVKPPPYDAEKTIDTLEQAQMVYAELNRLTRIMNSLPESRTDSGTREFERAEAEISRGSIALFMDKNGDGLIADEARARAEELCATGSRIPWNDLSFDSVHYAEMSQLADSAAERYLTCIDRLSTVCAKGTDDEYREYRALVAAAVSSDTRLAAMYGQLVLTARADGMAKWENGEGSAYAGEFNRLSSGRSLSRELDAIAESSFAAMSEQELITAINREYDSGLEAKKALERSDIYERNRRK